MKTLKMHCEEIETEYEKSKPEYANQHRDKFG